MKNSRFVNLDLITNVRQIIGCSIIIQCFIFGIWWHNGDKGLQLQSNTHEKHKNLLNKKH